MEKNGFGKKSNNNEFIINFIKNIKNINDIKTKSLEIKNNNNYVNNLDKNLLKEKDKKIEDLEKQCEELKKQLNIKNQQNNNFINNEFNTSTNFPVKNEIKKVWEELA